MPESASRRLPPLRRPGKAQGKQRDEGGPAAEVFTVLVVKRTHVALSVLGRRIPLYTTGATSAYTCPAHLDALAGKAKPMSEDSAAAHHDHHYPLPGG